MILDIVISQKVGKKDGVPIRLMESRWYDHILVNHPELRGHLETVLDAVHYPEFICRGNRGAKDAIINFGRKGWLHVFYKEVSKTDGFIITATIKKDYDEEKVIWSRHEQD